MNRFSLILLRFQQHDGYKESQQVIGWDEDACRRFDKIASQNHCYIAAWYERQRCENNWKLVMNAKGKNGLMKNKIGFL